MAQRTDISRINETVGWRDLTEGLKVYGGGTSVHFHTGEWTTVKADVDESKCIQCLLCTPVCPDSCILVRDGKRLPVDTLHCKGCGICAKVCPVHAITMKEGK